MARAHQINNLASLQRAFLIHEVIGRGSACKPYSVKGDESTLSTIYQDLGGTKLNCEIGNGILRVKVPEGVDKEFRTLIESYRNVTISDM